MYGTGSGGSVGQFKHGTLPEGAVPLTDSEVVKIMNERLAKYYPSRDVWALKHGHFMCGAMASFTGFLATMHYRSQFRLRHYARFSSVAPTMFIPALTTTILNVALVQQQVLTGKMKCPMCAEIRAASLQATLGVAQPVFLAVIAALASAKTFNTISFPKFAGNKEAFVKLLEMSRGFKGPFIGALTVSILGSMLITQEVGKQAIILKKSMLPTTLEDVESLDDPRKSESLGD